MNKGGSLKAIVRRKPRLATLTIATILLTLALPLYIMPNAIGDSFVGMRIKPTYLSVSSPVDVSTFKVRGPDNTFLTVAGVAFTVDLTNSYFMPVVLSYTGDQLTVYVYPGPVDQPGNSQHGDRLVWNATGAVDTGEEDNTRIVNTEDLSQHVLSVPPGGLSFQFFDQQSAWNGTDYRTGQAALPGDYYVYATAFGRSTGPVVVTVLPP